MSYDDNYDNLLNYCSDSIKLINYYLYSHYSWYETDSSEEALSPSSPLFPLSHGSPYPPSTSPDTSQSRQANPYLAQISEVSYET